MAAVDRRQGDFSDWLSAAGYDEEAVGQLVAQQLHGSRRDPSCCNWDEVQATCAALDASERPISSIDLTLDPTRNKVVYQISASTTHQNAQFAVAAEDHPSSGPQTPRRRRRLEDANGGRLPSRFASPGDNLKPMRRGQSDCFLPSSSLPPELSPATSSEAQLTHLIERRASCSNREISTGLTKCTTTSSSVVGQGSSASSDVSSDVSSEVAQMGPKAAALARQMSSSLWDERRLGTAASCLDEVGLCVVGMEMVPGRQEAEEPLFRLFVAPKPKTPKAG